MVACVPVPKASPGSSSSRTTSASGPMAAGVRTLAAGAHPESPPEAHRLEVLEPLALPGAVGDGFELGLLGDEQRVETGQRASAVRTWLARRCRPRKTARTMMVGQSGVAPGAGSSTGIVGCVEQRDGQRAEFEQRVFVRLGIARADVEAELQEGHPRQSMRFAEAGQRVATTGRGRPAPTRRAIRANRSRPGRNRARARGPAGSGYFSPSRRSR